MVKRVFGTLGLGLFAALLIVVSCYLVAGFPLALLFAIVLGVGVGVATIVEYFGWLEDRAHEERQQETELPKVYVGSATVDPDGTVNIEGDMPPELAKMFGLDGDGPPFFEVLNRIAERGVAETGTIEPELDCEGNVVGFNIVPDHGLSDRELKEVEEKWGT